jgi:putative Mn2+ efflux pump MntP
MSFITIDHFFHYLILDIILSFLLLCFIIFIDKYFRKNKDTDEEKRRKYQKDFITLLAVGLIVYFM